MRRISIRNAKWAKQGLIDMMKWIDERSMKPVWDFVMLEIGSYVGDSTAIFSDRCREVHSVDPFVNDYDDNDESSHKYDMEIVERQFDELVKERKNIFKYKMTSQQASVEFKLQMFDLIYIDGLHTYQGVKDDIELWLIKAKYYIAGHDFRNRHHPEVEKAVLDSIGEPNQRFRDTSWIKTI